jgi:excisionase family DNA binding protein
MNHRYVDARITEDGPLGLGPELVELLRLIPAIRQDVAELRRLMAARRKSHFTVEEFAAVVGRAPYTVRAWIKDERIAAIRVAGTGPKGRLLIPREEIEKLIAAGQAGRVHEAAVG